MKVFKAICLEDRHYTDGYKEQFLKRGKEYTISAEKDGQVMVFSTHWFKEDAGIFGGVLPLGAGRV